MIEGEAEQNKVNKLLISGEVLEKKPNKQRSRKAHKEHVKQESTCQRGEAGGAIKPGLTEAASRRFN